MAGRVRQIIVPEMNLGQMAHEVEWAAAGRAPVARVNRVDGEPISPLQILEKIEETAKQ
jgi:2-oxoglutarate ferredoxin oxidoreductase subunit alpha